MHFDDRLDTVLRLPATSEAFARIQYRQLIDILGSDQPQDDVTGIEEAYRRLDELSDSITAGIRADMLRPTLARLRNPRLLAHLAEREPSVASAAIGAADLSESEWLALIPALPVRARGILRHRRGLGPEVDRLLDRLGVMDRGLPPAHEPLELVDELEPEGPAIAPQQQSHPDADAPSDPASPGRTSDIAALLKRIEHFSKTRRESLAMASPGDAPRLPLDDHDEALQTVSAPPFDFATDTEGRITWAEPPVAPMVAGMRIASAGTDGALVSQPDAATAFRHRQPLRNVLVSIAGAPAVSGDWHIDAVPRFDAGIGGFSGYAGRFRRPQPDDLALTADIEAQSEANRIREIIHELKTPANAIQMSAEIVQQNLFGPTPHEYRALAAMIASDVAYVLAGFDELERLAKLEAGAIGLDEGECDLATVTGTIVEHLQAFTAKRQSGFAFECDEAPIPVSLDGAEAERLVWRLLAVLAGEAVPGESLTLRCSQEDSQAVLAAKLPASLASRDNESLFHAASNGSSAQKAISAGMFGSGVSLRLARAEAKAAGGALQRDGNHLSLRLPLLLEPVSNRETA